jgi:hypothetical protein
MIMPQVVSMSSKWRCRLFFTQHASMRAHNTSIHQVQPAAPHLNKRSIQWNSHKNQNENADNNNTSKAALIARNPFRINLIKRIPRCVSPAPPEEGA